MADMTCGEGVCLLDEDYEGSFVFIGHLFEQSPGFSLWVVVMRVMILEPVTIRANRQFDEAITRGSP